MTLRNKGIVHLRGGGRGDFHVHVQVTTPRKLSNEQKKLLQQLSESLEHDEGGKTIFEKVKDVFS